VEKFAAAPIASKSTAAVLKLAALSKPAIKK